jgi:hypothetical protein
MAMQAKGVPACTPARPAVLLFMCLLANGIIAAGDAGPGRAHPGDNAQTPRPPAAGVGVPLIVPPNPFVGSAPRPLRAEESAARFTSDRAEGVDGRDPADGAHDIGGREPREYWSSGEDEGEWIFNPAGLPRADDEHLYPPASADAALDEGDARESSGDRYGCAAGGEGDRGRIVWLAGENGAECTDESHRRWGEDEIREAEEEWLRAEMPEEGAAADPRSEVARAPRPQAGLRAGPAG